MAFRRFLRGRIDENRLEEVAEAVADRYDEPAARVESLEADNWLSIPCVVNDRWFVKIISPQNSLIHAVLTTGRNLGAFSSGTEGFFEHFGDPLEMAEHELEATRRVRQIGVNAPQPLDAFEYDGLGVLVLEYLPEFNTLDDFDGDEAREFADELFGALATLHDHGLAHGDLRGENVLVIDGELYFIDATNVRDDEGAIDQARSYDLACALAATEPVVDASEAVRAAADHYTTEELLAAVDFLDFVNIRPDHDFDAAAVKGEIEKLAI